jgi:hypothetical protein
MTERYFAIFDDAVRRLKIVCMSEVSPEPDLVIMLSPYTGAATPGKVQIMPSGDPEQMIKRVPLQAAQHVYLWRSPWSVYLDLAKAWIPIVDSDKRARIPGEYIYEVIYTFYNPWYSQYMSLRSTMLKEVERLERESIPVRQPVPSAPPAIPPHKPPRFVAEIIKRDAIATKSCCVISLNEFTEDMKTLVTPCFHIFEAASLGEWIAQKGSCPACKGPVKQETCLLL